jgi:hypothetical protein
MSRSLLLFAAGSDDQLTAHGAIDILVPFSLMASTTGPFAPEKPATLRNLGPLASRPSRRGWRQGMGGEFHEPIHGF